MSNILLPVVGNLDEAERFSKHYSGLITAGPRPIEVRFDHPNHHIETFHDTMDPSDPDAPTAEQVERMLEFARQHDDIFVHCHMGMSRSTATAWGIAIDRGFDPIEAYEMLKKENTTIDRAFYPNDIIVNILEEMFGVYNLSQYNMHHNFSGYNPLHNRYAF